MSQMNARQVIGSGTLNVMIDGTTYTVAPDHPNYKMLKEAFNEKDGDKFLSSFDVVKKVEAAVNTNANSRITVQNGTVYLDGKELTNSVTKAITALLHGGFDFQPLLRFLERVLKNPSKRSVEELWSFLEVNGLMLTEDGCFLAYKSVKDNYLDKYSGTYDNTPGAVLRMERNQVDDDFTKHCSTGFHVGALAYSGPGGWYNSYGDKVIICKVAPEDVVSVPNDHNCQKLRTCAYEVVGDYKEPLNSPLYSGKVGDEYTSVVVNEYEYVEELDVEDLLVGHVYSFTYSKDTGDERRCGLLRDKSNSDAYVFYMSASDKSAGNYRSFSTDYMYDIEEVKAASNKASTNVKF